MSRKQRRPKNPYQKGDRFTKKAKSEGFAARSVYKLSEIDQRTKLLKPGMRVLDLGCAPGSWSAYAAKKASKVVGVDIKDVPNFPGTFIHADIAEVSADRLREELGGSPHVVLSDMAQHTVGDKFSDHVPQMRLVELALDRALDLLEPGGHFVAKVFDGQDAPAFVKSLRDHFETVRRFKPEATRKISREFFVLAMGYRGQSAEE